MDIVPHTIYREARGEGLAGMTAVAWVIHNRAVSGSALWSRDPEKVCLQRKQFSCWNDNDPNRDIWPNEETDKVFQMAEKVWATLEETADPTNGATYYINPQAVQVNLFDASGYEQTAVIGRHVFYKRKIV